MRPTASLRSRIWLAVGATALPILVFSLFGHLERRDEAVAEVQRDIRRMLQTALFEERAVVDNARQVLHIMARSNELRTLDAAECAGIAGRLLETQTNLTNVAAALPDGKVFCSGRPMKSAVSFADRSWFREALGAADMTSGHYQTGRITGKAGVAFGLALRDDRDRVRAVLSVATTAQWLDRMAESVALPEHWSVEALDREGRIIASHPDGDAPVGAVTTDSELLKLVRTQPVDVVREATGADGQKRVYGVTPLKFAGGDIYLAIRAPTENVFGAIDQAFYRQVGWFALIFALSALLGWFELRRSFLGWAQGMGRAVRGFGCGAQAEAPGSEVRELAELSAAFVEMKTRLEAADRQRCADVITVRESEQRLRMALETGNEGLWDWDFATGLAYFSPTYYSMLGYEADEFPASFDAWVELLHPAEREDVPARLLEAIQAGDASFEASFRMRARDGGWRWIHGRASVVARDAASHALRIIGTNLDITERRRREDEEKARADCVEVLLALNEHSGKHREREFLAFGLAAAERLTGSRIGFLHLFDQDRESVNTEVWTESTLRQCGAERQTHCDIGDAGLWAESFRQRAPMVINDYAGEPAKRGTPSGHAEIVRLVTVPAVEGEKVRLIVGVGNKPEDYGAQDVETLRLIGGELWRIIHGSRIERALAESERQLRSMLETVDLMAVMLDRQGRVVFVNDYWVRMTGWSAAEAVGEDWFERFLPEQVRSLASTFHGAIAAGEMPARMEHDILMRDGGTRRIAWTNTLSRDPAGAVTGTLSLGEDVTEKRLSEVALAESWERFYSIFNTISEAIFLHDAETGGIVEVNDAATAIYGYSRDELLAMDFGRLGSGEAQFSREAAEVRIQRARAGEPQSFEWRAKRCDGSVFWVEVNVRFIAIGGRDHLLAVVQDIAERKAYEAAADRHVQKLTALNDKLEDAHLQLLQAEKMASIGQLAAGVAHEINNPVGYVYSNIGSLAKYVHDFIVMLDAYERAEPALAAEAREEVQRTRQAVDLAFIKGDVLSLLAESREGIDRVRKIVQDLKDFSRVGIADEWEWADLHACLDSTLNIVWNELKYKTTVDKQYGELPQVYCVPSQINQVFMNLLVNAAHAIETSGVVTLRSGRLGDDVWVEVEDTGSGIAPEDLKRIFDPFFTTKPVGKGTGLGLSVSYSIVQKHRGRIEVRSEVGKGTAFKVWLPIGGPADAAAPPRSSAQTYSGQAQQQLIE